MFCSGCGQVLAAGQPFCPQCGRQVAPPVPPVPGFQFQVENYAGKIKALGVVWLIYAVFSFLKGVAGLTFARAFLLNHFGGWEHGPWGNEPWSNGPEWLVPIIIHAVWAKLIFHTCLALVAAWGLLERTQWGRILAIVAAILSLLSIPFGTAIGIWTLVLLLGYRNSTLYEQLQ
jgi:hypothetical protein